MPLLFQELLQKYQETERCVPVHELLLPEGSADYASHRQWHAAAHPRSVKETPTPIQAPPVCSVIKEGINTKSCKRR